MSTSEGVSKPLVLSSLRPGSSVDVETMNRHYRLECLGGNSIRISGHPRFCPTPTQAQLEGSIDSNGELEEGIVGRGMRLMFFLDERYPVTTSSVVDFQVAH